MLVDNESYGDGGAFAEILVAQYPHGLGRRAKVPVVTPAATSTSAAGAMNEGEPTFVAQSTTGTLVVKHFTNAELQLPSTETTEQTIAKTMEKLEAKIEETTSVIGNRSQRHDPLDPRAGDKKQQQGKQVALNTGALAVRAVDPAPIVRSPTKKPKSVEEQKQQEELTSVPFCVSNWTNKKSMLISTGERAAHAHVGEATELGSNHLTLAVALNRAKRDVEQQLALSEQVEKEAREREQSVIENKALQEAQHMLEQMEQHRQDAHKMETKEERRIRLRLEKEHREREREVKARLRRRQDAAARLGITLEALEADAGLLQSVDDAATHVGDLSDLVDSRVQHATSSTDEDISTAAQPSIRETTVSTRGIADKMTMLEHDALSSSSHQPQLRPRADEDDDSDDDIFGVSDLVAARKQRRTE